MSNSALDQVERVVRSRPIKLSAAPRISAFVFKVRQIRTVFGETADEASREVVLKIGKVKTFRTNLGETCVS